MFAHSYESWFAVQVSPRHEAKVACLLGYKGYQHVLPTYRSRRTWSDRIKTIELPIFPGYVFCKTEDRIVHGLVLSTPGVIRVVGFNGRPYPISDQEIDAIRKAVLSPDAAPCPYLKVGQRVRITNGPMAGVIGILAQVKNRHRLVISVELIMKSIAVDVDARDVLREEAGAA
jgi:transcription antitermination factor NusG